MAQIFMDHAATTPLSEGALSAMMPFLTDVYGNASSVNPAGERAKRAVFEARQAISFMLDCEPRELIFTSGATEADNQAIQTAYSYARAHRGFSGHGRCKTGKPMHMVTTAFEHPAVLRPLEDLEARGLVDLTKLSPGALGVVTEEMLEEALTPETVLVSIMAVNNEVGTIQPVKKLVDVVRRYEAAGITKMTGGDAKRILFHTDATQAMTSLLVDADQWGVDLLAFSAHKFNGPKGVGGLICRGLEPASLLLGGEQERGHRAGTLNVPGIVGMQKALEESRLFARERAQAVSDLGRRLSEGLSAIDGVHLTVDPADRVAGIVHVTVEHGDGALMVAQLGRQGISASAGSACQAGAVVESETMLALDVPENRRRGALRFSLGHDNTAEEVDAVIAAMREIVSAEGENA